MAGPIRRLIQRRPVRNAVRRLLALPEIGGRSSAMTDSRTGGRLARRLRPQDQQFRSLGETSSNASLRGPVAQPGTKVAPPQKDADAPDTTATRVFPLSDPEQISRISSVASSDAAQSTDLDAAPRKVGGTRASDSQRFQAQRGTTALKPTQDAQEKQPRSGPMAGDGGQKASQGTQDMAAGATPTADKYAAIRIPRPDFSAMQAEVSALRQQEAALAAQVQTMRVDPGLFADPTRSKERAYQTAEESLLRTQLQRSGLEQQMRSLAVGLDVSDQRAIVDLEKLQKDLEIARIQNPAATPTDALKASQGRVPQIGILGAANTDAADDMVAAQQTDPNSSMAKALQANAQLVAASTGIANMIRGRARPTVDSPEINDLAVLVYGAAPNDPAQRAMLLSQYLSGGIQQAGGVANPAAFSAAITQLVEKRIAAFPQPQAGGFFPAVQSYFRPLYDMFDASGPVQNWGGGK